MNLRRGPEGCLGCFAAGALPETQSRNQTRKWTEQHREAHVEWRRGCAEPIINLTYHERTDPVSNDHGEKVNADAEPAQFRTGNVVNVRRRWTKPHE